MKLTNCERWSDCFLWNTWIADDVKITSLFCRFFLASVLVTTVTTTVSYANSPSLLFQEEFIGDARDAINLLYNREYEASLNKMSDWQKQHPDHPVWMLWESIDAWWPVIIDLENTSNDEKFIDISLELIDYCDKLLEQNEENLDARIVRSIAAGQIARFYSNRNRWYRSFRYGRRALNDLFYIEESYPDIPDLNFGIGMYRYFSAFLVEEYALARRLRWMLPSGDRAEGLARLEQAADSSIFLEPEASYFLGHINLHFERKPNLALGYLRDLYFRYPDNTFYRRLFIRSLYQLDHQEEVLARIEESLVIQDDHERHDVAVMLEDLHTLRGQLYYKNEHFNNAQADLIKAVQISEQLHPFGNRSNLIVSLYYLGEISLHNGRREDARYFFSRAATAETDHPMARKSRDMIKKNHLE